MSIISERLYSLLVVYIDSFKTKLSPDLFLFPNSKEFKNHISRQNVWQILKRSKIKLGIENLHPHALRHTFATHHISKGTSLPAVKKMLGHTNYNSTLVYTSVPIEDLRQSIDKVTLKNSFWDRFKIKPKIKKINIDFQANYYTIGRNKELKLISKNAELGINTILIGQVGLGKSHILNKIETSKKILRLDDTESIKKSLLQILLYLYEGDKKPVKNI